MNNSYTNYFEINMQKAKKTVKKSSVYNVSDFLKLVRTW